MLWRCCEFRGGNRVQRGKYPGFRMDSEEPFVTLGSRSCSCLVMRAKWNRKKVFGDRLVGSVPDPSRGPSRGKIAPPKAPATSLYDGGGWKTRVAQGRICAGPVD